MTPERASEVLPQPGDIGPVVYEQLLRGAPSTGRCPVWLGSRALGHLGGCPVPGDADARIGAADAATVLRSWWPGPCPVACGCRDPYTDAFPDPLVRAGVEPRVVDDRVIRRAVGLAERAGPWSVLAVVDARRPADVPAALGWSGIRDRFHQDLVGLGAVLRSWEERFGAVLVRIDASTLHLAVADPPRDRADCERLAAEHFAFCPDQQTPQDGPEWTLRRYATSIAGGIAWCFRWD